MRRSRLASLVLILLAAASAAADEAAPRPADPPAEVIASTGSDDVPPVLIPWPMPAPGRTGNADWDDDPLVPLIPAQQARPSVPLAGSLEPAPSARPATTVVATAGATKEPAATITKKPGTLTESELSVLAPSMKMPAVGARVVVTEMTPPTSDVRRWQFEKVEGLTWESEEALQEGDWVVLRGKVDVRAGIERIRADEIRLSVSSRRLEAEGNVILDRLDSRLTGRRLEYDTATNTGVMYDAMGYTADDLSFTAKIAEKVAENKYVLRGATFTSCTQPAPIWQVNATKAVVEIDRFVYLWNPRVRFGKVPLSYLPWVAFPIKQERATGFMIPRISSSSRKGTSLSEEFFWAINRSTDMTIGATYWQKYGFRLDGQARWFLPGMSEYGYLQGVYLKANKGQEDVKLESERYLVEWEHRQRLGQWDLTFTGELATDSLVDEFDGIVGNTSNTNTGIQVDRSPILNQRLTLQRRWGKHSLNIQMENDERGFVQNPPTLSPTPSTPGDQLVDGTKTDINRSLPLVEWRASGIQLGGKKWATFDLEASVASLTRGSEQEYKYGFPLDVNAPDREVVKATATLADHSYTRMDVYPQFSFPLGTAFLRVIPEVNFRGTWWSRVEKDTDPTTPLTVNPETLTLNMPDPLTGSSVTYTHQPGEDEALTLFAWDAGVRFEGPDFERIYNADAEPGQRKWQHLIEPSIEYTYAPEMDRKFLITGDARASHYTSRFPTATAEGGVNEARLRLVNTLRNKRVVPPGSTPDQPRDIVIWTLSSTWDLDRQEQAATFDGRNETTRFASIQSDFNIRPTDLIHFSLRNTYDVLADDVTSTTLTGGTDWNEGYLDVSFSSRRNQQTMKAEDTDLSLTGEHWFYKGGRIRIGYDITRKIDERPLLDSTGQPAAKQPTPWIYKRLVLSYYNQCIGLSLSWEDNANRSIQREKEWTFIVSLKDLGNFLRYRRRMTDPPR